MPTALRIDGYRLFFFSNEGHEPAHIHVEQAENLAKYWLESIELAWSRGFRAHELTRIRAIVTEHRALLLEKWHEHFGGQG